VLLIFLIICVVLLCVFTFCVRCCNVRYDFRLKRCSTRILFTLYVFACVYWCPTYIVLCFCFVCLSLCCQFLWIVKFVLPLRYSLKSMSYDDLVYYLIFKWLMPSPLLHRTNSIHMTTSVSRRLNILWIMFKIVAFSLITLLARLYVSVGILTCGQDPRDCIMSTKREVLADNTSSTPPLFIAVPVSSQGEW
jgi:hypothetical protein